ncbi:apolipoprotein N-acyltransferase [Subtercola boreus]|uniref:Apolipoprotein N-acyltransferase n=1 Tax=Subtercola boreus TaxID=120213 RepID=A0A3E0V9W1_9MICO|nr:apolipoprotein N-acyltransferase [Subtercola boreus]RFA06459.1 apolipoprotein N-acyltransferase [Subtercola boreus]TQL46905.1 apolipoprotein N-acyltransferase [Subtercola boreus]
MNRSADISGRGRPFPPWLAVFVAGVGGLCLALAFPAANIWVLVFVGLPLIFLSLMGQRVVTILAAGFVGGGVFWGVHIFWLTVYLGPLPWAGLSVLETVFFAAGCMLIAFIYRASEKLGGRSWLRMVFVPPIVAGLWTVREMLSSSWPYGGFSWGRLTFSQSDSPFGPLTAWVGVSGVSFCLALVGACIAEAVLHATQTPTSARGSRVSTALFAVPAGVVVLLLAVPTYQVKTDGSLRVAAVQGNADAGLFSTGRPGDILTDHVTATQPITEKTGIDLLVWPENSIDLDPLRNPSSAKVLDNITARVRAPLVGGTITKSGQETFNSLLLWEPDAGPTAQYDKIHPVPFAEYLPDRDFWFPLAPDLFSLIPRDLSIGTRPNVFSVADARAGLAICFDIVDDRAIEQMIAGGANIILAPSNNADFGRSEESVQQLAIARIRAIQTGRSLVSVSTVGTSAIISADGGVTDRLPTFTKGAMVQDVPLSSTLTPAMRWANDIEIIIITVGLGGAGAVFLTLAFLRRTSARVPSHIHDNTGKDTNR